MTPAIIEKAAKLIEHNAEAMRDCCFLDGKWDHPDDEALYLDEMETARQLREFGMRGEPCATQ